MSQPHTARQPIQLPSLSALPEPQPELPHLTAGALLPGPLWSSCPKCTGLLSTAMAEVSTDPSEADEADISLLGLASGHGKRDQAHRTTVGWKVTRCLCELVFWGFQPNPAVGCPAAAPPTCARALVLTCHSKHTERCFSCHPLAGGWELPE